MSYTTLQKINIEKVSQYLCSNDIAKKGLFGGGVDLTLPRKLYCIRKSIEWCYNLSNNESALLPTSNYMLAMCAPYSGQGAVVSGSTSGGSVSPINPGAAPTPYDFVVTGSSFIANGESSKNISAFKGYNLLFIRNGVAQSIVDSGGSFYSWNKATGDFTCTGAASTDETFQLYPFI